MNEKTKKILNELDRSNELRDKIEYQVNKLLINTGYLHVTIDELKFELKNKALQLEMLYTNLDENFKKLNIYDFKDIIFSVCHIVKSDEINDEDKPLLIYHPDLKKYIPLRIELLNELVEVVTSIDTKYDTNYIKNRIKFLFHIDLNNSFQLLNFPPNNIVKFNNVIYDVNSNKKHNGLDKNNNEYNFISQINYNIKGINYVNKELLEEIDQMFNEWSNNNEENKELLKQVIFSTLENSNPYSNVNAFVYLKAKPEDCGKHVFQDMLKDLVNDGLKIHLRELSDGIKTQKDFNKNHLLTPYNKLILIDGFDENIKKKIDAYNSVRKLMCPFRFNRKINFNILNPSKDSLEFISHALVVNYKTTDIDFYKNKYLLYHYLLPINWQSSQYDEKLEHILSLDNNDPIKTDYMEALISYIVYNIEECKLKEKRDDISYKYYCENPERFNH